MTARAGHPPVVVAGLGLTLAAAASSALIVASHDHAQRADGIERARIKRLAAGGVALAVTFVAGTGVTQMITDVASTAAGLAVALRRESSSSVTGRTRST